MKNLQNILLLFTIPFVLLSFSNCGSKKNMEQELTFEKNQEAGRGVNLHINFKSIEKDVVVINFYFRGQVLETKFTKQAPKQYVAYWRIDNTRDDIMHSDEMQEAQNTPRVSFPFDLMNDEAVIEYWSGGNRFFYKLSDIKEKQMISYPGAKPTE